MYDSRDPGFVCLVNFDDRDHERIMMFDTDYVATVLFLHSRRERPEPLAKLRLVVQNLPHVGTARISKKTSCAECSRAELHTTVEPTDYRSIGDHLRKLWQKYFVVQRFILQARVLKSR